MIKSIFITLYLVYLIVGGFTTGVHFSQDLGSLTAFAALLAQVLPLFWFVYIYTMSKANASFVLILISVGTGISTLIALASFKINQTGLGIDVIMAAIAFTGWLLYNYAYAKQAKDRTGLKIGEPLPDGTFTSIDGKEIALSSIPGKKLLVFHRGNWCPFCVDQKNDLNARLDEFRSKGTSILFISSQVPKSSAYGEGVYDLQDSDLSYGTKLGIAAGPILPLGLSLFGFKSKLHQPYAVLVNEKAEVMATHKTKDYRVRPSADYFLRFLD